MVIILITDYGRLVSRNKDLMKEGAPTEMWVLFLLWKM